MGILGNVLKHYYEIKVTVRSYLVTRREMFQRRRMRRDQGEIRNQFGKKKTRYSMEKCPR